MKRASGIWPTPKKGGGRYNKSMVGRPDPNDPLVRAARSWLIRRYIIEKQRELGSRNKAAEYFGITPPTALNIVVHFRSAGRGRGKSDVAYKIATKHFGGSVEALEEEAIRRFALEATPEEKRRYV